MVGFEFEYIDGKAPSSHTHCITNNSNAQPHHDEEHDSSKEAAKTVGFQFEDKLGSLKGHKGDRCIGPSVWCV